MLILNLDENFTPFGKGIEREIFNFPSGVEPHIKIKYQYPLDETSKVKIACRIKTMNDLMLLFLANDALKRIGVEHIECFIPYLPFARQDRVMIEGEPLSIKVLADLINLQNFKKVSVYDVHSETSLALINNSNAIVNHHYFETILHRRYEPYPDGGYHDYTVVAPDAGACKKIYSLCQSVNYTKDVAICNKIRDTSNGKILEIHCTQDDFYGKDIFIIDDICDGGATFVLLAECLKLRNCGQVNLVVSHGIFSKGIAALFDIDHIYTTDSFSDLQPHKKLTQIKLQSLLPQNLQTL